MEFRLADNFSLPVEAVTQTFAILAVRGSGKTYTAMVMAEEMIGADQRVIVVDPVGVCWGLRSSADGKSPGLSVLIFGGEHGDVPLEPTAGSLIADVLVEHPQSAVLDLSLMRKGEQVRFMTDFSERLYLKNREPVHLILDEADAFAPQRPMPGEQRMLGAVEDLVRRGRARGIGISLVTQRAAVLNKNVLTQVECLIALRTISPQDKKAVQAWVDIHGDEEKRDKFFDSLPSLERGQAWVWSPGWLDVFKLIRIRERRTFDSSRTPKAGQKVVSPKKLAPVDLDSLGDRIKATVEQAKANNPAELRREVTRLKAELLKRPTDTKIETKIEYRDKYALRDAQIKRLESAVVKVADAAMTVSQALAVFRKIPAAPTAPQPSAQRRLEEPRKPLPSVTRTNRSGGGKMGLMLEMLARLGGSTSPELLASCVGINHGNGTWTSYISLLRSEGKITTEHGSVTLTDIGKNGLPSNLGGYPSHDEVIGNWRNKIGGKMLDMIDHLLESSDGLDPHLLAEKVGINHGNGTWTSYVSILRRAGLIKTDRGLIQPGQSLLLA